MEEAILCAQKRNLILLEVSGKLDKHPFNTMGDLFSFESVYDRFCQVRLVQDRLG